MVGVLLHQSITQDEQVETGSVDGKSVKDRLLLSSVTPIAKPDRRAEAFGHSAQERVSAWVALRSVFVYGMSGIN